MQLKNQAMCPFADKTLVLYPFVIIFFTLSSFRYSSSQTRFAPLREWEPHGTGACTVFHTWMWLGWSGGAAGKTTMLVCKIRRGLAVSYISVCHTTSTNTKHIHTMIQWFNVCTTWQTVLQAVLWMLTSRVYIVDGRMLLALWSLRPGRSVEYTILRDSESDSGSNIASQSQSLYCWHNGISYDKGLNTSGENLPPAHTTMTRLVSLASGTRRASGPTQGHQEYKYCPGWGHYTPVACALASQNNADSNASVCLSGTIFPERRLAHRLGVRCNPSSSESVSPCWSVVHIHVQSHPERSLDQSTNHCFV